MVKNKKQDKEKPTQYAVSCTSLYPSKAIRVQNAEIHFIFKGFICCMISTQSELEGTCVCFDESLVIREF